MLHDTLTVLFVDDEAGLLLSIRDCLRSENWLRVLIAESAAAALELLRTESVQVVVSDHMMPGMSGVEFLGKLNSEMPNIIRILTSAYINLDLIIKAVNDDHIHFVLLKPVDARLLTETLEEARQMHEARLDRDAMIMEMQELNRLVLVSSSPVRTLRRALNLFREELKSSLKEST